MKQLKTFIFSPHCDDEWLGVGYTLYLNKGRNENTYPIIMCIGTWCHKYEDPVNSGIFKPITIDIRKGETINAMSAVGIPAENVTFMDYPDRKLSENIHEATNKLLEVLESRLSSEILVYVPSKHDNKHPDHAALYNISKRALNLFMEKHPEVKLTVYGYTIRGKPEVPNSVRYTNLEIKERMYREYYKSQYYCCVLHKADPDIIEAMRNEAITSIVLKNSEKWEALRLLWVVCTARLYAFVKKFHD
jgi:LmbE family N-acetylglucosaminyl deacetylase